MKNSQINRNKRNSTKATKSIDNKNSKSNLRNKDNVNRLSKTNINFINLKKALIAKNNEESNIAKRKSNRNLKQKSIDYTFQNNIMNNTMNKSSFKNQTFATRLSKIDNNSSKPQTKNSNKKYQ